MVEGHSQQRPAPSASGLLRDKPLVHLLVYARNKRLTGLMELRAPESSENAGGSIVFWRGRITDVRTSPPIAYFGTVAYELGRIDNDTLDATLLELAKTKRKHGEILIARGAITAEERDEILVEQTCRKVHHLCGLPDAAQFAFYEAAPNPFEPELAVDPIGPVWRALRAHAPAESVREVVSRFAQAPLRMVNEGPISKAGLTPEERALCNALTDRPMSVMELRGTRHLPPDRADLLAYLLVITKCAEPAPRESAPQMPAARPTDAVAVKTPSGETRTSMSFRVPSLPSVPAARTSSSSRTAAVRTDSSSRMAAAPIAPALGPADLGASGIATRAATIQNESYSFALGLADDAPAEAARAAYFRLAKLWHPDRLPKELEPFRAEVTKIFEHLTTAHRVLTDKEERRAWQAGKKRPNAVRPKNDVMKELDRALLKPDWSLVAALGKELLDESADDVDGLALTSFAAVAGGEASDGDVRAAIASLDAAIQRGCYSERTFYYRGLLNKRVGSGAAAYRDFTRAVQLDPKHIDAQRELRILEMRARKGSGEHALDALVRAKAKK